MMYGLLVTGCWVAFLVYWLVAGLGAKRNTRRSNGAVLVRIILVLAVLITLRSRGIQARRDLGAAVIDIPFVRVLGVVLCAVGIAYAIWARWHIGRNWGMPMSVKERPELVRSGPYAYSRHPIYAGVLLALAGSAVAVSLWWLVGCGVALVYFTIAARQEERTMIAAFPIEYPDYQRRTKMIVPFVF